MKGQEGTIWKGSGVEPGYMHLSDRQEVLCGLGIDEANWTGSGLVFKTNWTGNGIETVQREKTEKFMVTA